MNNTIINNQALEHPLKKRIVSIILFLRRYYPDQVNERKW